MRIAPVLFLALLGLPSLGAGHPSSDADERASLAPGIEVVEAQEPACFLARGTLEEAAQRPSPLGQTEIVLGGHEGLVCYGRPYKKGRTIFGGLVPFGQPWRVGANEATALHLPFSATVGGIELDPGSYSLFAIPGEGEWEIVVNGNAERWGVPINDEVRGADVGSFTLSTQRTDAPVEQLTFSWEAQSGEMGRLVMEWENTRIEIPVRASGM